MSIYASQIVSACGLFLSIALFTIEAQESSPVKNARPTELAEFNIALSPEAKVKRDREVYSEAKDLLRKAADGDARAKLGWVRQPLELRAQTLADTLNRGATPLRLHALNEVSTTIEALNEARNYPPSEAEHSKSVAQARAALLHALVNGTVQERDEQLREKAFNTWLELSRKGSFSEEEAAEAMGQGLDGDNSIGMNRAFGALKGLGGPKVWRVLSRRVVGVWGPGPRNHIMIATQRSYIDDYDVSGAVFDPVVRSLITGVVLDTRQLNIEMIEYLAQALSSIQAPLHVRDDPARWEGFIEDHIHRK